MWASSVRAPFLDERYEILSETTHFLAIGSFSFLGFGFACFWAGFSFFLYQPDE